MPRGHGGVATSVFEVCGSYRPIRENVQVAGVVHGPRSGYDGKSQTPQDGSLPQPAFLARQK